MQSLDNSVEHIYQCGSPRIMVSLFPSHKVVIWAKDWEAEDRGKKL